MLETLKEKWDEILLYLKNEYEISNVSFQTWLLPLEIYSLKQPGNIIQIIVPDANFLGYIKKKYSVMLKVSIEEVTGIRCDNVEFIVEDEIIRDSVSDNQLINATPNAVSPVTLQNANLNPKYTFDSFVVDVYKRQLYAGIPFSPAFPVCRLISQNVPHSLQKLLFLLFQMLQKPSGPLLWPLSPPQPLLPSQQRLFLLRPSLLLFRQRLFLPQFFFPLPHS